MEVSMTIEAIQAADATTRNASTVGVRSVNGNLAFHDVLMTRPEFSSGRADLDAIFDAAGSRYNISPNLLKAVAKVESGFRPDVTSKAGAMGIMQLMPGTARALGVTDAYDPEQNIMGGATYLRDQLDRFGGDIRLALAAYNAGGGAVAKYGGIPPYKETQAYVPKVLGYYNGGDITAGFANYNSASSSGGSGMFGSVAFTEALSQMFFMKIIELQMSSGSDDKKSVF